MITQIIPIQHQLSKTASFYTLAPMDFSAWDIVTMNLRVEAITGSPTSASLKATAETREPWDAELDRWVTISAPLTTPEGDILTEITQNTIGPQTYAKIVLKNGVDFSKYVRFYFEMSFVGGSTPGWTSTINLSVASAY